MGLRDNRTAQTRYGIAELFGKPIDKIAEKERQTLLNYAINEKVKDYPKCPFRLPSKKGDTHCSKKGGVCSIRKYLNRHGQAVRLDNSEGSLTVTCPFRFHQQLEIFRWINDSILKSKTITLVKEIGFLEAPLNFGEDMDTDEENVGRIDMILVDNETLNSKHMDWCALEIQAVYFSGPSMDGEFKNIYEYTGEGIPFPAKVRRPDYRSSAPKRLMPQLQIKVPALRRWGKKMAIVVDRHFFEWMGKIEFCRDLTSSDIIWFVTDFKEVSGEIGERIFKHDPGKSSRKPDGWFTRISSNF